MIKLLNKIFKIKYENKIDNDISELPEINKVTADNMNNIKQAHNSLPFFWKGQIEWFKTKTALETHPILSKLTIGVDYNLLPSGRYVKLGQTNAQGGSSYLTQQHLPRIDLRVQNQAGQNMQVVTPGSDLPPQNVAYGGWGHNPRFLKVSLNPTGSQTTIDPVYFELYAVEFLRDITVEDLGE